MIIKRYDYVNRVYFIALDEFNCFFVNGCIHCGVPQKSHGNDYACKTLGGTGNYVKPNNAVILERMKANRTNRNK
jgi:hypothetical protein